jgi:hypothetical protein
MGAATALTIGGGYIGQNLSINVSRRRRSGRKNRRIRVASGTRTWSNRLISRRLRNSGGGGRPVGCLQRRSQLLRHHICRSCIGRSRNCRICRGSFRSRNAGNNRFDFRLRLNGGGGILNRSGLVCRAVFRVALAMSRRSNMRMNRLAGNAFKNPRCFTGRIVSDCVLKRSLSGG